MQWLVRWQRKSRTLDRHDHTLAFPRICHVCTLKSNTSWKPQQTPCPFFWRISLMTSVHQTTEGGKRLVVLTHGSEFSWTLTFQEFSISDNRGESTVTPPDTIPRTRAENIPVLSRLSDATSERFKSARSKANHGFVLISSLVSTVTGTCWKWPIPHNKEVKRLRCCADLNSVIIIIIVV